MTSAVHTTAPAPSRLDRLRRRHGWIDHLVRAATSYLESHGDHYAAAITYFSVVALVPMLMVAFAVAGYLLLGDPELLAELRESVIAIVGPGLGATIDQLVAEALRQSETVGILGLALAAYTGLAWMYRVREALSAQWGQRTAGPPWLAGAASDAVALLGLGLVLAVALGIVVLGDLLTGAVAGPEGSGWVRWAAATVLTVGLSIAANLLVVLWVIARLPRERPALRRAVRPALLAAVGFELIEQGGAVYLGWVTGSPAGLVFGPILGLLVAIYLGARLVLFATAWAATHGERPRDRDDPRATTP
ncbi:YhjD/YihY/BrkB family envelope integrity protein [Actinomycetospora sp.]|uniref:YhjD/YihY/BrkB family envelope integrity protein n=1 Tax=Actinomycetospora sp. TaxID=1872135 RepID=UPI002F4193CC